MENHIIARIENLLKRIENNEITVSEIEEQTGVSKMTISNLRSGKSSIEKTQLRTALALGNLDRSLEVGKAGDHRSALFGQLWGIVSAVSQLAKADTPIIRQNESSSAFRERPMTIFERLHVRMIELDPELYLKCVNQITDIMVQFEDGEFSDEPLDNKFELVAVTKKLEMLELLSKQ